MSYIIQCGRVNYSPFETVFKNVTLKYENTQQGIVIVDIQSKTQKLLKYYFNNRRGKHPELLAVILQECAFNVYQ